MPGPPKKPAELKIIQGTYRADRHAKNMMAPAKMDFVPDPPSGMPADAKRIWRGTTNELYTLGMLYGVDLALLEAYCREMATYRDACKKLKKEGEILESTNKAGFSYKYKNPWLEIRNKALDNARALAMQFGFTPSARTRITSGMEAPKDPYDELQKRIGG